MNKRNRILIAIASSDYDDISHLDKLDGVINDGTNIKTLLSNPSVGNYDISELLISPTLSEVRSLLDELVFNKVSNIDSFTFFFAGHGISNSGTYYLCLKDTFVDRLSTTALPINHIFNIINDKKPVQSNIIIDACEAGGVVQDLNSLIKPEVFGNALSPSVSLFCACMKNQYAEELKPPMSCGVATNEVVKFLSGELKVDTFLPTLDLIQIGRNVSSNITDLGYEQTPVVWGINLTGISTFSLNPHYSNKTENAAFEFNIEPDNYNLLTVNEKEIIWREYLNIKRFGVMPNLLFNLIGIVNSLKTRDVQEERIGSFLLGTTESLLSSAEIADDLFLDCEIIAACCSAFIPILENQNVINIYYELLNRLSKKLINAFIFLETDLKVNTTKVLVSSQSILSDLYYLPIRITKILGWLGMLVSIQKLLPSNEFDYNDLCINIVNRLNRNYSNSYVCVSENQAPYLLLYSNILDLSKDNDALLLPLKMYFSDFVNYKGNITKCTISPNQVLTYLLRREQNNFDGIADLIARPSELLSVLLSVSAISNLDFEVNNSLQKIDHLPLNIFLAKDIHSYLFQTIEHGLNITMEIGSEVGDGIFKLNDFRNIYNNKCIPRLNNPETKFNNENRVASALLSFISPNRVSWHS